jgi:cobalamin biosynthesis protein CobD/CbiB
VNLAKLRASLRADNIEWERHVLERLVSRNISRHAVLQVLRSGECIEDYPDDYPFPSALFFGWHRGAPLHVVAALDEMVPEVYIITTYEPDLEHFEADFKTRKKK